MQAADQQRDIYMLCHRLRNCMETPTRPPILRAMPSADSPRRSHFAPLRLGARIPLLLALATTCAADTAAAQTPWPVEAVAKNVTVQATAERFTWESAHFALSAEAALPLGVVRDLAAVFEATREVLLAVPLGLHPGGESARYRVRLFSTTVGYKAAGGATATGGYFDGREMLILLPNLGIKPGANGLTAEHPRQLFILKHEVTHQLLSPWGGALPVWLDEGFAECVASWPYTQGRYTLRNLDTALHDYLLKWRRASDRRALTLIAPPTLMALSRDAWREQVVAQAAYDHYNSAALLAHYFLRHDGRGDGAGLAAYFDAVRRGTAPSEAEAQHLPRGRTREQLTAEVQKLARRMAIEVK